MKYSLIMLTLTLSCTNRFAKDKHEIIELVNSADLNSQMKGIFMIGETRDSTLVEYLFQNVYDSRISHHLNFKGMSLYYQKMGAMEKMTNMPPPRPIDRPDSVVITFYMDIARKRGWID